MPIRGVMSLLGKSDDREIVGLIESGDLLWAWDLSLEPERARRKELRVLPECVEDFLQGRTCSLEFPQVLDLLVSSEDEPLLATHVQAALNITERHAYALIRRKLLLTATPGRRGHGGSARIHRYSFVEFLKRRCYPVPVSD
jgi:hypothetical protein